MMHYRSRGARAHWPLCLNCRIWRPLFNFVKARIHLSLGEQSKECLVSKTTPAALVGILPTC
eukprot:scaffold394785_cov47-Prasinocladus_malaysianus.AAC.2